MTSPELNPSDDDACVQRAVKRDSMFLKASVHCRRTDHRFDVVVRNISAGGLLADSPQLLDAGDPVVVTLRHVGEVPGRIIWAEGARFGIAFDVLIDAQRVRVPVTVRKPRPVPMPGRSARLSIET
jgi:hypothetical protein